jgi:hypothetical protein
VHRAGTAVAICSNQNIEIADIEEFRDSGIKQEEIA